jgi:uncharacterized protein YbcC (UPF0753/DUF2309 family)
VIQQAIERAGELLPAQGPISAFVFLNTLQALEHLPFDEGLQRGARLFNNQPYLSEDRYRQELAQGRIRRSDLEAVLLDDLGERADGMLGSLGTRYALRLKMLLHPLRMGPEQELRWFVVETDALTKMRIETPTISRLAILDEARRWARSISVDNAAPAAAAAAPARSRSVLEEMLALAWDRHAPRDLNRWSEGDWERFSLQSLWTISKRAVAELRVSHLTEAPPVRTRDLLVATTGVDCDLWVHELLTRFIAAYTDQGLARWELPDREQGFYRSFFLLYQQSGGPPDRWLKNLSAEISRLQAAGLQPLESIEESLVLLGVPVEEWEEFIQASVLALRGWAGLLRQMEVRADRVPLPVPTGTLVEFLAIRLILDRLAFAAGAVEAGLSADDLRALRANLRATWHGQRQGTVDQRAFLVFQLAQLRGWGPSSLQQLCATEWKLLLDEIESFTSLERRRLLHAAYERRFRIQALDALAYRTARPVRRVAKPRFQAVFCIDAREESFRRHLEEIAPDAETFGAAGFYGVAMYYRGAADAHFAALCPIVVRPRHWVIEEVVYTFAEQSRRRAATRKALGTASHQVHVRSRSMASGALLTAGLGVLASVPLVARVLFPRTTARLRRSVGEFVKTPPITRLRLERLTAEPGPEGDQIGYSLEEMTNIGERILREIGLIDSFARLVFFLGHGSACLNNPHKSAYDCGACSGSAGGPNARALAAMLNDGRVREQLVQRGIAIPRDTYFLGGQHNTCTDSITFFDLELLPRTHYTDYDRAWQTLEQACERNAHERCRRFQSAPLNLTIAAARRHVEGRAEDLAQTRPEFGNCTNAMCVVGRRARTRDLYLDRRSFLVSYDPEGDDAENTILARILGAVVVVCSGINLQYFFSYIDSPGWGSGTKLPHNVTSLLGVMDGAASDLRTGLPWQGVEIHEPVRLLMVIETTPAAMERIMERNPTVGKILRNGWMQLVVLDPHSHQMMVYQRGAFVPYVPEATELPAATSSIEWYRGHREHLPFALIKGN